jgi:hypothetical protein
VADIGGEEDIQTMNAIGSVEDAYQSLAQEIMEFVAERPWDMAKGIYQILTRSTGHKWLLVKDGVENKKGHPLADRSQARTPSRPPFLS